MKSYADNHDALDLPEMEAQHHYLFRLFDAVEHTSTVTDRQAMGALLDEIERYVMFHFTSEEHLMRAYGFSGFAAHQTDHEQAATKLVGFLDDFEADRLNPARLRVFLTGWLLEHSALSDTAYVAWIKQRRGALFGDDKGR
jgi:hemerythrin